MAVRAAPIARYSYQNVPSPTLRPAPATVERKQKPRNYWLSHENRINFIEVLAKRHGIKRYSDFYKLQLKQVTAEGGGPLLDYFESSFTACLSSLFPYRFHGVRFSPTSTSHDRLDNSLDHIISNLLVKHKVRTFADLQRLQGSKVLEDQFVATLFTQFQQSMSTMLRALYPLYRFKRHFFSNQPKTPWSADEVAELFAALSSQSPLKSYASLYSLRPELVADFNGGSLLGHFGDSISALITDHYGRYFQFEQWKFGYVPAGYWKSPSNCALFFDRWADEFKTSIDLTRLTQGKLVQHDGGGLLSTYSNSPYHILQVAYPAFRIMPWLFNLTPKEAWKDQKTRYQLVLYVERKLNLSNVSDWKRVSGVQIMELGLQNFISRLGGLELLLKEAYPNHSWKFDRSTRLK